jgi:hypothetical protein
MATMPTKTSYAISKASVRRWILDRGAHTLRLPAKPAMNVYLENRRCHRTRGSLTPIIRLPALRRCQINPSFSFTNRMRKKSPANVTRLVLTVALIASALISGCDRKVYADYELNAQDRFKAAKLGTTEQDVWSSLGTPSSVVTRTGSDELSVEVGNEGDTSRKAISASDRSSWPAELEFLPKRIVSSKVLVYIDGTATAYYFIGSEGRVEYIDLFTS